MRRFPIGCRLSSIVVGYALFFPRLHPAQGTRMSEASDNERLTVK